MTLKLERNIVDADWLLAHKDDPQLVILDASWHLARLERDGRAEWLEKCIPGSRFFDYDGAIKDQDSNLPRMLPPADLFTEEVRKLGINEDSVIVIYDTNDLFSAPRAWWMFNAMGHDQVAVLNGGLKAWEAAGGQVSHGSEDAAIENGDFIARPLGLFVQADYILGSLTKEDRRILDARSADRFADGHIPGSGNLPYTELLADGKLKNKNSLQEIFAENIAAGQQLVCSCGSGVTACIIALAAKEAGIENIRVYDGSWTEWSSDERLPVEKG